MSEKFGPLLSRSRTFRFQFGSSTDHGARVVCGIPKEGLEIKLGLHKHCPALLFGLKLSRFGHTYQRFIEDDNTKLSNSEDSTEL